MSTDTAAAATPSMDGDGHLHFLLAFRTSSTLFENHMKVCCSG